MIIHSGFKAKTQLHMYIYIYIMLQFRWIFSKLKSIVDGKHLAPVDMVKYPVSGPMLH